MSCGCGKKLQAQCVVRTVYYVEVLVDVPQALFNGIITYVGPDLHLVPGERSAPSLSSRAGGTEALVLSQYGKPRIARLREYGKAEVKIKAPYTEDIIRLERPVGEHTVERNHIVTDCATDLCNGLVGILWGRTCASFDQRCTCDDGGIRGKGV
ncbi:hypothetical protein Bbelb_183790 [Branchiostoma belcheri]|nr:hypothetical protein Bbelb_183790 [Branchiostoma belcheri]